MSIRHKYILIYFLLVILGGCNSGEDVLPKKNISVAINKYFKPENINDPDHTLQKKITDIYSKIVDSLSSVYGFTYFPNYRVAKKHKATFVLTGEFGAQHNKIPWAKKYFVEGKLWHMRDSLSYLAFGLSSDSTTFLSEIIRPRITQSTGKEIPYSMIRVSLSPPGMALINFVPYGHILNPQNGPDSLTSFSVNRYISAEGKKDKQIAHILTNLMNNVLVFNQRRRDLHFKPVKKIRYNYYPNYRNQTTQKAQYIVGGRLVDKGDSCRLIISFKGKKLNPMHRSIDSVISFNRSGVLKQEDYSEIILRLSQILKVKAFQRYGF